MRTATAMLLYAAVLGLGLSAATEATVHNITIGNNFFSPTGTVAAVGDTVRWTWVGGIPHSTTSDPSSTKFWDSGISSAGGFTFQIEIGPTDGPGPFPYHCTVHPGMQDTIFVESAPSGVVIPPGVDLWRTPEARDREFESNPIPADFFNPGSLPFEWWPELSGVPVQTNPPGAFGPTDLIIHRLDTAHLPSDGATDVVPIEIVALHLQSVQPITVTYNSGLVEHWQVQLTCASSDPAQSSMQFTRECDGSGAMTFELVFIPTYTFTRVFPPATAPPLQYTPADPIVLPLDEGSHWSTTPPTEFELPNSDGTVTVDHDLNPSSPDLPVPASTDGFFNGVRDLSAFPCDGPDCQGITFGKTKDKPVISPGLPSPGHTTLSIETGPTIFPDAPMGATCLPDGSCVIATELCALSLGAAYAGDFTRCSDNPCGTTICFESLADIHLNTSATSDPDAACGDELISWIWDVGGSSGSLSVPPEPIVPGAEIPIELVQLELSGVDPIFGPIVLRTRETRPSRGFLTVHETDLEGDIACGDMFVELFWEIELVDSGLVLTTGDRPIRVQTPFDGSVPIPADFFGPTDGSPVQMFVENAPAHFGWICGANFKPHNVIEDCLLATGACCLPDGSCADGVSRIECLALTGIYAGDNSTCVTATCPSDWRTDTLHATGEIQFDLPPLGFEPELLPGFPPPVPVVPGVCLNPGPIIIRIPDGPYSPGEQIQTEILEMNLHGTHPTLGPFVLSEDPDFASQGSSTIDSVDLLGRPYLVDSFFDIYVRIDFEDTALQVHTGPTPIYLSSPGQSEPIPIEDVSLSTDECDNPVGHLVNRLRAVGTGRTTGHIAEITIDINNGSYKPSEGISFQQVDFEFENYVQPNSDWGRVQIDVPTTLGLAGLTTGFLNVYTNSGWAIQNLYMSDTDGVAMLSTYFTLNCETGVDVPSIFARVEVTPNPQEIFVDSTRELHIVEDWRFNAEGREDLVTGVGAPPPTVAFSWDIFDPSESFTQPNKSNVQTADDQCFPMSIANSLQYLEDRYGLPVPHHHGLGLKGDTTLVGQLDSTANRGVTSRANGQPTGDGQMMTGKFQYLADNGLERKLVLKHQGGYIPAGDYTAHGITSKDESDSGHIVTWQWICNELKKGEDVEACWTRYDSLGNSLGGHAFRVFECGNTWGIPWIGYVHDADQTSTDPGDSLGLECVREFMIDLDGDGQPNLGSVDREIDFAISESADTDMDGVTNELDNSPNWFNPGQEDGDGNGTGDVEESSIRGDETIASFDLSPDAPVTAGPFTNQLPPNPDHKDLWFVGTATNPSASDTVRIVVSFTHGADATPLKDTTRILPGQTREIFGSALLDYCPEQVSVVFTPVDGAVSDISGTFHHLCYGVPGDACCIGTTGNVDNDPAQNVTLTDLTLLVNHLFVTFETIPCPGEANTNGDNACAVNLSDLTVLVNSLFVTFEPTAPCNPLCD